MINQNGNKESQQCEVEINDEVRKAISNPIYTLLQEYKEYSGVFGESSIENNDDYRLQVVRELLNAYISTFDVENKALSSKLIDLDHWRKLNETLCTGTPVDDSSPSVNDNNIENQLTSMRKELNCGMVLIYKILNEERRKDGTDETEEDEDEFVVPSHLYLFELIHFLSLSPGQDLFSIVTDTEENEDDEETVKDDCNFVKNSCVFLFMFLIANAIDYVRRETHQIQQRTKNGVSTKVIRWKRLKSLMLFSIQLTFKFMEVSTSVLESVKRVIYEDDIDAIAYNLNERFHTTSLNILLQYVLPSYHEILLIYSDPTDLVISLVGLLSYLLPSMKKNKINVHLQRELCKWILKIISTTGATEKAYLKSMTMITPVHVLTHPLRTHAVSVLHKKNQKEFSSVHQEEAESEEDVSDEENYESSDKGILYSNDPCLNKLARVTRTNRFNNGRTSTVMLADLIPWSDEGIAIFASNILHSNFSVKTGKSDKDSLFSTSLYFPAVYNPLFLYQLFFPHTPHLFLCLSTSSGYRYLELLSSFQQSVACHASSRKSSRLQKRCDENTRFLIPQKIIVEVSEMLLDVTSSRIQSRNEKDGHDDDNDIKSKEQRQQRRLDENRKDVQMLELILSNANIPAIRTVECVRSLIEKCTSTNRPEGIPLLMDYLRFHLVLGKDDESGNRSGCGTNPAVEKAVWRILEPFVAEMKEHNEKGLERLLQRNEIYLCAVGLLRRLVMGRSLPPSVEELGGGGCGGGSNGWDLKEKILGSMKVCENFQGKIETLLADLTKSDQNGDSSKPKNNGFRLFLLQDAIVQFLGTGKDVFKVQ